jgi:multicomponent Na+:H+ antiporter subunit F
MITYYALLAGALIICLLFAMLRIFKGDTAADKMIAAQLFGTLGVAILIAFSFLEGNKNLLNVALVMSLLAPISLVAFVTLSEEEQ